MRLAKGAVFQRGGMSWAALDTASNYYDSRRGYVEIIRQDSPVDPHCGIALGFEFDEANGDYPYTPAFAVVQFKDFTWGSVEFSATDTLNYTGVSDSVSDDVTIEVLSWRQDTITGRFSGLLLNGAGDLAPLDSGYFKVRLRRKK